MFDFSAIDKIFLTRFLFALCFYWAWGILAKGIFEPIQSYLGKKFVNKLTTHSETLRRYADQTCSDLDDFFINHLADSIGGINRIVNENALPQSDQQLYRQLVIERYQLSILFKKMGLDDTPKEEFKKLN